MQDLLERITIVPRQRHIDGAQCNTPNNCVIARTVLDTVPGATEVSVGAETVYVTINGEQRRGKLHGPTKEVRRVFDEAKVWPAGLEIHIDPPRPTEAWGARAGKSGSGTRKGKRANQHNLPTRHVAKPDGGIPKKEQ